MPTDLVKLAEDILMTPYRTQAVVCPYCLGTAWAPVVRDSAAGQQGERCTLCAGNGYIIEERRE